MDTRIRDDADDVHHCSDSDPDVRQVVYGYEVGEYKMNYIVLILLIAIGIYDLYLAAKKHPTLSQQYQRLLPGWADLIVFNVILYFLIVGFPWMDWRLKVVIAGIVGHICWSNRERYEK